MIGIKVEKPRELRETNEGTGKQLRPSPDHPSLALAAQVRTLVELAGKSPDAARKAAEALANANLAA
jgi:hypothetical protein